MAVHGCPMSRMAPVESTVALARARATSTFAVPSGTRSPAKVPTVVVPAGLHWTSMRPGWSTSPPGDAAPEMARTWLLLKMYCRPSRVMREPSVPPQQNALLASPMFDPDVPILMGGLCGA